MFRPAVIHTKAASTGTGIKVRLAGTSKSPAKMIFVVSAAIAQKYGWAVGDKFEVLIGEKTDHGLIRVRKNNSVGIVALSKKGGSGKEYFTFSLGHQPLYVDRSEAAKWCSFEGVDGWVQITLPRWALETDAGFKASEAVTTTSGPKAPHRAGVAVTASVLGDPPPGRSALSQRAGQ